MQKMYQNKSSTYISTDCQRAFQKSKHRNYETGQNLSSGNYGQAIAPRERFKDTRK